LSSTRHYAPNTNQLLTNYSFTTRSLALSLALFLPIFRVAFSLFYQGEGRFETLAFGFAERLFVGGLLYQTLAEAWSAKVKIIHASWPLKVTFAKVKR